MEITIIIWIACGTAVFAVGVMFFLLARGINLARSKSPGQKPETVAAAQANDERIAAPFAEQIEDVLRALLNADPALATLDVDLGTAPDGGLEIWVNGERHTDIDLIPDERLRQAIRQAVEKWGQEN